MIDDFESKNYWSAIMKWWLLALWWWLLTKAAKWVFNLLKSAKESLFWVSEDTETWILWILLKWLWISAAVTWGILAMKGLDFVELAKIIKEKWVAWLAEHLLTKIKDLPSELKKWAEWQVQEVWEIAWETVNEWLDWMDDKLWFTENKDKFFKLLDEYNILIPEWLDNFSKEEVAKTLWLDQLNLSTWENFKTTWWTAWWFALLIISFFQKRWIWSALSMWSWIYLLLIRQWIDSPAYKKIIWPVAKEIDEAKKNLIEKANDNPTLKYFIPDFLETWKLEDNIESLLEYCKNNPTESTVWLTGVLLFKWFFFNLLKKGIWWAWNMITLIAKHPIFSTVLWIWIYVERKNIIREIWEWLFDDDQEWKKKFFGEVKKHLSIDVEKHDDNFDSIMKSFAEFPIEALKKSWDPLKRWFKNWDWSLQLNELWIVSLLIWTVSVPVQLGKWAINEFITAFNEVTWFLSWDKNCNIWVVPWALVWWIIFTNMTIESAKAYKIAVLDSADGFMHKLWKGMKSFAPWTAEWRFIWRSAWLWVPGVTKYFKWSKWRAIWASMVKLEWILTDLKSGNNINYKTALDEIDTIKRLLDFDKLEEFKKLLPGNSATYQYMDDIKSLRPIILWVESALARWDNNLLYIKPELKRDIKAILKWLNGYKSLISNLAWRYELIIQWEFRKAFSSSSEHIIYPIATDNILKWKTQAQLRTSLSVLKIEIKAEQALISAMPAWPDKVTKTQELIKKIRELNLINWYLNPTGHVKFNSAKYNRISNTNVEKAGILTEYARQIESVDKWINMRIREEMELIKDYAKTSWKHMTDPAIVAKIEDLDKKMIQPYAQKRANNLRKLMNEYKALPKSAITAELKQQCRFALHWAEWTFATKLVKWAKWRMKILAVMGLALTWVKAYLREEKSPEEDLIDIMAELWTWKEALQLLIDILPFTWTLSTAYASLTWSTSVTWENVSWWKDRLANAWFSVAWLAADILMVMWIAFSWWWSVAINITLRLTQIVKQWWKAWAVAQKLLNAWPKISEIAWKIWFTKVWEIARNVMNSGPAIARTMAKVQTYAVAWGIGVLVWWSVLDYFDTWEDIPIPSELQYAQDDPGDNIPVAANDEHTWDDQVAS